MRTGLAVIAACLVVTAAQAQTVQSDGPSGERALLRQVVSDVSADQLHATIEKLVGFGTRHTASDTRSNTRGIGAARRWVASQFQSFSQACGGCLEIVTPSQTFTGDRLPQPTEVMDVAGDPARHDRSGSRHCHLRLISIAASPT